MRTTVYCSAGIADLSQLQQMRRKEIAELLKCLVKEWLASRENT